MIGKGSIWDLKANSQLNDIMPVPFKDGNAFVVCAKNHATNVYKMIGIDQTDGRVISANISGGTLVQSSDWGATWSSNKSFPTDVAYDKMPKIIRFKDYLYAIGYNSTSLKTGIYRAAPASGNTAFTWSTALVESENGGTYMPAAFNCDANYIYWGEYGSPSGGPIVRRSADGTTWETIYGPDATINHIHGINPDPYNPGHVWMTCGDTGKAIQKSTDYGATWSIIVASSQWQSVQISFSKKYVYFAGDASYGGTVYVYDRATGIMLNAAQNHHRYIAVPGGAASDMFWGNAYIGVVDSDTDIYYCIANDTSASGNRLGLFYLNKPFRRLEVLDPLISGAHTGEPICANGYLWFGQYKHKLLTV